MRRGARPLSRAGSGTGTISRGSRAFDSPYLRRPAARSLRQTRSMVIQSRGLFSALLVAALFGIGATPVAADTGDWVFAGTVAGSPAVAELTVNGSQIVRGRFFYRRFGRDIVLEPERDGTRFLECGAFEGGNYVLRDEPCAPTGVWDVTATAESIKGSWRRESGKGVSQPVLLTRVPGPGDNYDRLRLSDNRLRVVATKSEGNVAWRVVREERSRVDRPFLTRAPDPAAMGRVNAALEKEFHEEIVTRLGDFQAKSEVSVVFANERLFAITTASEVWGGAHSSNGFGSKTFDLRTGDEVRWNEILRVTADEGTGFPLDLRRRDVLAADVLREAVRLKALEDGECLGAAADYYSCAGDTCTARDPILRPSEWTMYPTAKGLAVAVDVYPEAGRGCRGEVLVVPWPLARKALRRPTPLP